LKESIVGSEVYGRPPSYDPGQDSIVRTEARRLRSKLKEYYQSTGGADLIQIELPLGTYAPQFRRRTGSPAASEPRAPADDLFDAGPKITIAVIPLVAIPGSAADSMSRGLTEELTHALAHTPGLRIASSTAAQLGSQPIDIPSLAQKLDVEFLVEGSVCERDGRVRVGIRLITAKGFQISSHMFEAEVPEKDCFKFAARIASAMASRLRPEKTPVRKHLAANDSAELAAIPFAIAGESLLDQATPTDRRAAMGKFLEALEIAPSLARAFCGVALCHCDSALSGIAHSAMEVAQARAAAANALELDAGMIAAHQSMACVLALEGNWAESEAHFQKVLEIDGHAGGHRSYGVFLAAQRKFDEAWYHLDKAQQIDPFSQRQKMACARFFRLSGRIDEAAQHFEENRMFGPPPLAAELCLAIGYAAKGDSECVRALVGAIRRQAPNQPQAQATLAECLALCGESAAASEMIRDFNFLDSTSPLSHFRRALLLLALKQPRAALKSLKESAREKEAELLWLLVEPRLDALRTEKGFFDLRASVSPQFLTARSPLLTFTANVAELRLPSVKKR
jgi:TolB-like protein/Tfp pilus assembly protein PilF